MSIRRHPLVGIAVVAGLSLALPANAASVFSSLEQYNYQVGDATLALRSYDGFDDYSGPVDSNGVSGVSGLTLSINGGPIETILYDPEREAFKRRKSWTSLEDMIAARPVDGAYTHTLSGAPSGPVTITAPGHAYADAIPANPLFTISGVNGTWSLGEGGAGIFTFDPRGVPSFTITMNAYSDSLRPGFQQGDHYAYGMYVWGEVPDEDGLPFIDSNYSSGLLASNVAEKVLSITFYNGLPLDAGDGDPSTFGFSPGSSFEIEGELVNIFNFHTALVEGMPIENAFIYMTVTSLTLQAAPIPEPETYALLLAGLGLVGFAARRRRPA